MANEGTMKRKAPKEDFGGETPLVTPVMKGLSRIGRSFNIMLTDRGLYESAKKRLDTAYRGAVSKIRSMFRRK